MGNVYTNARALKQDYAEALTWYRRAAANGFAPAQFNLALAYELGRGVPADEYQAFKFYLMAAEQGYGSAQFNVGNMYANGRGVGQDLFESGLWYRQAAEKGLIEAQFNLGLAYETGRGVGKDEAQAARWYKLAADRGFVRAQYNLGLLLEDGRGVSKDEAAAAALYRAAAEQGFASAQNNYGLMFSEGRGGLPKDPVQAFVWLSLAVQNGANPAARDFVAKNLTAEQRTAASRLLAERSGARAGNLAAAPALAEPAEIVAIPLHPAGSAVSPETAAPVATPVKTGPPAAQDAAANQRLAQEKAGLEQELKEAGDSRRALEQVREQNRRLSTQVQSLLAEKVAAERSANLLANQISDLKQARRIPPAAAIPAAKSAPAPQAATDDAATRLALLQEQLHSLQREKAELDKWAQSLEKTLNEKSAAVLVAETAAAEARQKIAQLQKQLDDSDAKKQLAEANQALEKSGASVAELTAENDRLGKELAAARQARPADAAAQLNARNDQLVRDNEELTAFMTGNRRDLDQAQARVAELENQLRDARAARPTSVVPARTPPDRPAEASQAGEKLRATVAELTAENDKLEKDLDSARKSTAAALAAQSQAVSAAQPDAYQMEIGTLQARVRELENQLEDERGNAAKDVSTMASQLQRARETNKSLTEANRALAAVKDSDTSTTRDGQAFAEQKARDLTAAGEELRRQNLDLTADNKKILADRDALKAQLEDARKVATVLPGLADEKAALQERLEAVGAQLGKAQQDLEAAQGRAADLTAQLVASRQAAESAQGDLAAVQARATEAEKAAESHHTSVAELTEANSKLEQERADLRRQAESAKGDLARLAENAHNAEQQRDEAARGAQQNIDALTAQLEQARRELDGTRLAQTRQTEAANSQVRESAATIAQLRQDNSALLARLTQAQGTLDQIASTARLGTPAATIASGGNVPSRPLPTGAPADSPARIHTVGEGDSLSRISMRYYGTPNRWQEVYQANRDVLQGSSVLRIGMQLRIP